MGHSDYSNQGDGGWRTLGDVYVLERRLFGHESRGV